MIWRLVHLFAVVVPTVIFIDFLLNLIGRAITDRRRKIELERMARELGKTERPDDDIE